MDIITRYLLTANVMWKNCRAFISQRSLLSVRMSKTAKRKKSRLLRERSFRERRNDVYLIFLRFDDAQELNWVCYRQEGRAVKHIGGYRFCFRLKNFRWFSFWSLFPHLWVDARSRRFIVYYYYILTRRQFLAISSCVSHLPHLHSRASDQITFGLPCNNKMKCA